MSYLVFIENFCVWYYDFFSNCFIIILCYLPFTQWQNRQIPVALHIIFFYIKNWHIKKQDSKVCYQIVAWTYPLSAWEKKCFTSSPTFIHKACNGEPSPSQVLHASFTFSLISEIHKKINFSFCFTFPKK